MVLAGRSPRLSWRPAILDLGKAMRHGHPDFKAYSMQLKARGKPGGVIMCVLGNRANRVAFAMMRDQSPFDIGTWPRQGADRVMEPTGLRVK